MKEIEENGYNLNISRYVSTAIKEEEIDLAATHAKLVEIDEAIRKATKEHNKFLKELGLPPLP
jgi:type I restriction enzyme M protein